MIVCPDNLTTKMQLGMWGEAIVRQTLKKAGFDAKKARRAVGGDIVACGLKIEVKTANQGTDGTYSFCLTKDDKYGATNHERADVVVLLAVAASGIVHTFVIPCAALANKPSIRLTRLRGYRGKYAEYRKPIIDGLKRFIH